MAAGALVALLLSVPALLPPAGGATAAGTRIVATALVATPQGAVPIAVVRDPGRRVAVSFACRGIAARTTTTGSTGADAVALLLRGHAARELRGCRVKAGGTKVGLPSLASGRRSAGAPLIAVLGKPKRSGDEVLLRVVTSRRGRVVVESQGGGDRYFRRRLGVGIHRLILAGVPRGISLVVKGPGRWDVVSPDRLAAPSPSPTPEASATASATPTATPTPEASPTPSPSPSPAPSPSPSPPAGYTLSIACSSTASPNEPISVSGRLDPPESGAEIVVRAQGPESDELLVPARTDDNGDYSVHILAPKPGRWLSTAEFEGDPASGPVKSETCETTVSD